MGHLLSPVHGLEIDLYIQKKEAMREEVQRCSPTGVHTYLWVPIAVIEDNDISCRQTKRKER